MKMNDAFPGKYLKQEDFEPEKVMTIKGANYFMLKKDDGTEEKKVGIIFEEDPRPLIMNKTNWADLGNILGSTDSDDWIGQKATFYRDPNVRFGSKVVGGIKVKEAPQDGVSF